MPNEKVAIPPALENMLLEFTINAVLENPADLLNYAAEYFSRLRDQRDDARQEGSREYIAQTLGVRYARRSTVLGERYNPEEDDDAEIEIYPKTDEERERIKQQTKGIFLFKTLDDFDLESVIEAMIPKTAKEGEVVIQQGEDGDYFYLIDKGIFDIFITDAEGVESYIDSYDNVGFFGELSLLHNQPRAATIKAASDGALWAVGRSTFNKLIVKRAYETRQAYIKLLEGVKELKPLSEHEKMQLADSLTAKSFVDGDVIVRQGDVGDGMYFIVEGKVSVQKKSEDSDEEAEVAELEKGAFFGEMALVKHQPRNATVTAIGPTKVAFLDNKAFERLLGPCISIMERHIESYDE